MAETPGSGITARAVCGKKGKMTRRNRIVSYIQMLVLSGIILCNGGVALNPVGKSGAFPCAAHQCGCKSESDCRAHCCCAFGENPQKLQNKNDDTENSLGAFISSIQCKYGSNPFAIITFVTKYILENRVPPVKAPFLCFFHDKTSTGISTVFKDPPQKPPRRFS